MEATDTARDPNRTRLTLVLDRALASRVRARAGAEIRSLSDVGREALAAWLEAREGE